MIAPSLSRVAAWLDRPFGRILTVLLALLILLLPNMLYQDYPRYFSLFTDRFFSLFNDDFSYTSRSLNAETLLHNLLEPHNTHVVPLFRAWTFLLIQLAGTRGAWITAFSFGVWVPLLIGMLAIGHLVARETGSIAVGIAAMAILGITTSLESVLTWYAAGQALWSGVMVIVALVFAQAWRARGRPLALIATVLACIAAPLFWTGGLAAMPAVAAYLWTDGRKPYRRAAYAFLGLLALASVGILILSQRNLANSSVVFEVRRELLPRPLQALLHICQLIPESLVAGNLGLDTLTTPAQGVVLTIALIVAWLLWARRHGGPTPLSIAGAATLFSGAFVVYYFRGNFPYTSLRDLGWYHAVPHVGAALLVSGLRARRDVVPSSQLRWPSRSSALAVAALALALYLLHAARYERHLIQGAPPLVGSEVTGIPIPELQYLRARYFMGDHTDRQRRALARLDRAQQLAAHDNLSRDTLRQAFGTVLIPGMLRRATPNNAFELLAIPESGGAPLTSKSRATFAQLLATEPEPRPFWLLPTDQWPPTEEFSRWIGGD